VEPRVLYPSRLQSLRNLGVTVGGIAFTAGGMCMISDGWPSGWIVAGFFGLLAAVSTAMLLPSSCYLRIGPQGFEVRYGFRSRSLRWSQVTRFGVWRAVPVFACPERVVFNLSDDQASGRMTRHVALSLNGWHGALPTVYSMPAADLAEVLNAYRSASVAPGPGDISAA
jgi:hypothetical protein